MKKNGTQVHLEFNQAVEAAKKLLKVGETCQLKMEQLVF
jgi:hypothetical protein